MKYATTLIFLTAAPALAHPGMHVHPHDGTDWYMIYGAIALIALVGGVAVSRFWLRK